MKRILISLALGITLFASQTNSALACSCISDPPPLIKLRDSDVVFIGTAQNTENKHVDFKISDVVKGQKKEVITVDRGSDSCMVFFEEGKEYLVYTYQEENGTLSTNTCLRNKLKEEAEKEIKIIKGEETWNPWTTKDLFALLLSGALVILTIKLCLSSRDSDLKK